MASLNLDEIDALPHYLSKGESGPWGLAGSAGFAGGMPFLRSVIDHLPGYLHVKDLFGRFICSNQAFTDFLGASTFDEVSGKTDADFFPEAVAQQHRDRDQAVIDTKEARIDEEEATRDHAGRERWFSTSRIPLTNGEGMISAILCVSRDITEQRQAAESLRRTEAIYRTLIEGLPQRVFVKDAQSAFVSVNEVFAKDLGRHPEDLVGKTDFDLFPSDLAAKYRADDQRVMQNRKPEILEEANVSEGQQRIVEVVKVPVLGNDDTVVGLLGIFTDITERKRAEKRLKTYAAKLQWSNRELQDFAYVASHDLQEPLRKVAVFGTRLEAKYASALDAEGRDYVERMVKATHRMQTLINDLLSFARVTTQAKPFTRVDLATLAREVMSDLETRLEQTGGRVEIAHMPTIEADPVQMRQLFQNLIGNALKFRRPDVAPVVKISGDSPCNQKETGGSSELGNEMCQIKVEDNGIGFEEKYTERIFQVFQRLHNRNEYEGSGIGLAICRRIVERHGGEITAKGVPGQGATFIIRLPINKSKEENAYE